MGTIITSKYTLFPLYSYGNVKRHFFLFLNSDEYNNDF